MHASSGKFSAVSIYSTGLATKSMGVKDAYRDCWSLLTTRRELELTAYRTVATVLRFSVSMEAGFFPPLYLCN